MTDEQGNQRLPKGQGGHENKTEEPVDVPGVPKGGGVGDMSGDGQPTLEDPESSVGSELLEGEPQGDADEISSSADERTIQPIP